jgi:hypothetical protein
MKTFPSNYPGVVIELRRYTATREHRTALARRCDEAFAPAFQQRGGVAIGHFSERGRPDGVAWLRAFRTRAAREAIGQAVDARAEPAADEVLLLRALYPGSGLALPPVAGDAQGIVVAHILHMRPGLRGDCARIAEARFAAYRGRGVIEAGILITCDAHAGASGAALVWLGVVCDDAALASLRPALDGASAALAASGLLAAPTEVLVLDPCRHSRLRWVSAASVTAPAHVPDMAAA